MKISNIHTHYKVNVTSDKADICEKTMFLNFKFKYITGGACCLTRFEIIVGKLHIYIIKKDKFYLTIRITTLKSSMH